MTFSAKTEYGVRLMIELGRHDIGEPTALKALAEAEGLPLSYLEHLVDAKADIVAFAGDRTSTTMAVAPRRS